MNNKINYVLNGLEIDKNRRNIFSKILNAGKQKEDTCYICMYIDIDTMNIKFYLRDYPNIYSNVELPQSQTNFMDVYLHLYDYDILNKIRNSNKFIILSILSNDPEVIQGSMYGNKLYVSGTGVESVTVDFIQPGQNSNQEDITFRVTINNDHI